MSIDDLPIRGLGSINPGVVTITRDIRPLTEEDRTLAVAVMTTEVTGQLSEIERLRGSLIETLEEVSKIKEERNRLVLQAISEVQAVKSELTLVKASQEAQALEFCRHLSEVRRIAAVITEIRLHQQRTAWRRFVTWITRG